MSLVSYDLDKIEYRLKEILEKEKVAFRLTEEQFKDFLMMLSQVCRTYLKEVEKEESREITSDLDEEIIKVLKKEKLLDKFQDAIPVQFFLQYNFHQILDVEPSYYKVRDEVLKHSKMLMEHPKSADYLLVKQREESSL